MFNFQYSLKIDQKWTQCMLFEDRYRRTNPGSFKLSNFSEIEKINLLHYIQSRNFYVPNNSYIINKSRSFKDRYFDKRSKHRTSRESHGKFL